MPAWSAVRVRTIAYSALLLVVAAVMLAAFLMRSETELTVQRDRSPNFVLLSNGDVRNSYTVKILNKSRAVRHFALRVDGLPGAALTAVGGEADFAVHPDAVGTFRVFLTSAAAAAPHGSASIVFEARDRTGAEKARHGAVFVGPGK